MIRGLLLDLDGTLIHSEPVAARALSEVLARYGHRLELEQADAVIGRTWQAALKILDHRLPATIGRQELLEEVLQLYRLKLSTEVAEVPGAAEAVRRLSKDFTIAVVSGSYRDEIEQALQGLGVRREVSLVLGAEDYPRSKPEPDGYLLALKRLGYHAGEVLVFEDSEPGMASGLAAGARVVAVTHCRSVPEDSPWLLRAHHLIENWNGVDEAYIRKLTAASRLSSEE
ncbi:MAG: HAD family hydrolase [Oligoflexia bacterium]|jgi:HAD superfamily hydrolase (TIGR01509 family)